MGKALSMPVDLEDAADAILESAGALGRESGIYTQAQLTRKIRNELEQLPTVDQSGLPAHVIDCLVERQIDELIEVSRLTTRQEIIYRLHLCGLSIWDTAATLRLTAQAVAAQLRLARRKLQATYAEGRYAGWYEVYLSEVNRPAYRRR